MLNAFVSRASELMEPGAYWRITFSVSAMGEILRELDSHGIRWRHNPVWNGVEFQHGNGQWSAPIMLDANLPNGVFKFERVSK